MSSGASGVYHTGYKTRFTGNINWQWPILPALLAFGAVVANQRYKVVNWDDRWTACSGVAAGMNLNLIFGISLRCYPVNEAGKHASDLGKAFDEELPQFSLEAAKALGGALREKKYYLAARLMERFPAPGFLDPEGLTEKQIELVKKRNPNVYIAEDEAVGKRVKDFFSIVFPTEIKGPWSDLYGPKQEGKPFDYQLGVLQHWYKKGDQIDQFNFVEASPLLGEYVWELMDEMTGLKVAEVFESDVGNVLERAKDLESLTIHLDEDSDGSKLPVSELKRLGELIIVSHKPIVDQLIQVMGTNNLDCDELRHKDGRYVYKFLDAKKLPANQASVSNWSFSVLEGVNIVINEKE